MPRQFDVYAPRKGPKVIVIQSDILEPMPTRVVIPLLGEEHATFDFGSLTPRLEVKGERLILAPQLTATLTVAELGAFVTGASAQSDRVIRAMDALLGGI